MVLPRLSREELTAWHDVLQVTGSQAGIAGLRVEVTQAGGVPLEALQKSIAPAWRNLQQQHSQLEALAQVSTLHFFCLLPLNESIYLLRSCDQ